MKSVKSIAIARPVKVVQNSTKRGNQWGRISCAQSGAVLHTGQLPYIKRVAKVRYNFDVNFG